MWVNVHMEDTVAATQIPRVSRGLWTRTPDRQLYREIPRMSGGYVLQCIAVASGFP